jgi:type I restriction enzyme S subunit
MTADLLLDFYERVAEAPDAIVRLRRFVLDLAVRGKLVPQEAGDEPASVLLKRALRDRPVVTSQTPPDRLPFDPPSSWCWTMLGSFVLSSDAGWSPKTADHPRRDGQWGVLKVSAVSWHRFQPQENKGVLPGTEPRLQAQVSRGDFLISRANTAELVARAVIMDSDPAKLMMSDKIVRLRLSEHCDHRFVWLVNNYADFARQHYATAASGVSASMKNVSRDVILAGCGNSIFGTGRRNIDSRRRRGATGSFRQRPGRIPLRPLLPFRGRISAAC